MLRSGALLYFGDQTEGVQNPIQTYTNCASANNLVVLLWCTELAYWVHPGVSQGVTCILIPHCIGPCHGQILIETASYSLCLIYNIQISKTQLYTLLFIFLDFYIINLPTITGIQLLHGLGANIVTLYKPV